MILFPNCKINLGLRITGKRADGYHNLETVFFPLAIRDALELTRLLPPASEEFELVLSGVSVPGESRNNLCYKAWAMLRADFPDIDPIRLQLIKAIPVGAGLGGGSSDGAHTLLLLNSECQLELSEEQLIAYALRLGSDCPFFILNKPCLATGRGEIMKPATPMLDDYYFVVVNPGVHISTAWAFSKIKPHVYANAPSLEQIIAQPVKEWKNSLFNDFEKPVFEEYEDLKVIRDDLYATGAAYASLTGSGSSVYGIFHREANPDLGELQKKYQVYDLKPNR